ncbi:MAG: nicotinate (nicotinamide) nucleotide adenylyltransferase [Bacteroidota bacterium]|nr:nicotinate (nicotinamide) nucleotide adenylyltransferase [Bacteroidota bacterium]
MKIGLYFGSFNPVHNGHLIIAKHIINYTERKQVWFIISPQNPLKKSKSLLNEQHRKHLIDLCIDAENVLKTSNVEFNLPRPSYTIDTLTYLSEKYPQHSFSVIMGSDSFSNIKKWKNYDALIKNYDICIYERPGFKIKDTLTSSVTILKAPLLEISSTYIREMIKEHKSIRFLVPDVVMEEIERQQYYR